MPPLFALPQKKKNSCRNFVTINPSFLEGKSNIKRFVTFFVQATELYGFFDTPYERQL
jgi:hypothetical protein